MRKPSRVLLSALCIALSSGCSLRKTEKPRENSAANAPLGTAESSDDALYSDFEDDIEIVSDALEPINRVVFAFNDKAYKWLLKPISSGYKTVTPEAMRNGIGNFFHNVAYPIRLVNSTLQGNVDRAARETGKFVTNTTVGALGFLKVSEKFESLSDIPSEDLGQTFGSWGLGHGHYIVLPILGPTSLRDAIGRIGDSFLHPHYWTEHVWNHWEWGYGTTARTLEIVNESPAIIKRYEALEKMALDPYISLREAYIQNRNREVGR